MQLGAVLALGLLTAFVLAILYCVCIRLCRIHRCVINCGQLILLITFIAFIWTLLIGLYQFYRTGEVHIGDDL